MVIPFKGGIHLGAIRTLREVGASPSSGLPLISQVAWAFPASSLQISAAPGGGVGLGNLFWVLLARRPKRLCHSKRANVFWDRTFLTPYGERTASGVGPPAGTPGLHQYS